MIATMPHLVSDNEQSVDGKRRTLNIEQWDTFRNGRYPLDKKRAARRGFNFAVASTLTQGVVMRTLTVAWLRWRLVQVIGRNPLVRTTDQIEAALIALAVAVSLAAIAIAGAVGASVHEQRGRTFSEEALTRHRVAATVTGESVASSDARQPVTIVGARWRVGDTEHTGAFTWDHPVNDGQRIDIWIDQLGNHVNPPTPTWRAGADAVAAGVSLWLLVTGVTAGLFASIRPWLIRIRNKGWKRGITALVDDNGGRTNQRS